MSIVGYAPLTSRSQNLNLQLEQLADAGRGVDFRHRTRAALCIYHEGLTFQRIKNVIDDESPSGLDDLLENAPMGFASFVDCWIPHTPPCSN